MSPQTARTLLVAAAIALVIAFSALSPALSFLLAVVAALLALAPAFRAPRLARWWGVALLALALVCAASWLASFRQDQSGYRKAAGTPPATTPTGPSR
ncbi:MAG TPA: hypothetical protein VK150_09885 [Geothrix sp.]|nr:hypothetical protein [Geothrix sp.]